MPYFIDSLMLNSLRNGLFSVCKPKGITSAQTLEVIKNNLAGGRVQADEEHYNVLRAGHGGTLDSSATGVLVVGLQEGCKLLTKFLHGTKQYTVVGELGTATDTYNELGETTQTAVYDHVGERDLKEALKRFEGKIKQRAPKYSALKQSGIRLSDLARRGEDVVAPLRQVICYKIRLLKFSPPYFQLSVTCGSGFYVRSLIHDLGLAVRSCAHVTQLIRTKQGPFHIEDSLSEQHWTSEHITDAIDRSYSMLHSYFPNNLHRNVEPRGS